MAKTSERKVLYGMDLDLQNEFYTLRHSLERVVWEQKERLLEGIAPRDSGAKVLQRIEEG